MNKALSLYNKVKNDDAVVHIREATKRDGEYTKPYPIGYSIFDDAMKGGAREGDLIIGTGIAGHGKTTFFQNISVNLSKDMHPCMWFSYEVIIDNFYAKFKEMGATQDALMVYTPKQMTTGNLEWVEDKIKEGIKKFNTKFIFIDHIDFLSPKKVKNTDQKRMILKDICMQLKIIAVELKIVIFLVAHVKKVQGRAIEMQDIAESSGVYQLADTVYAVTRNNHIERRNGIKVEVFGDVSTVRILKNRFTGIMVDMDFVLENNIIKPLLSGEPIPFEDPRWTPDEEKGSFYYND